MFSLFRCQQCIDVGCVWSQNGCSWATAGVKNVRIHVFILYTKAFPDIIYVLHVCYISMCCKFEDCEWYWLDTTSLICRYLFLLPDREIGRCHVILLNPLSTMFEYIFIFHPLNILFNRLSARHLPAAKAQQAVSNSC